MALDVQLGRRELLVRGLAAGGAAVAAPLLGAAPRALAKNGDAAILEQLLGAEVALVTAYTTAIDAGFLDAETRRTVTLFAAQDKAHADRLRAALRGLGETPPTQIAEIKGLSAARTQPAFLALALDLEDQAVAQFYEAAQKLSSTALLVTSAQIMANDGQHLAVLRQALGRPPVPGAFATGKP